MEYSQQRFVLDVSNIAACNSSKRKVEGSQRQDRIMSISTDYETASSLGRDRSQSSLPTLESNTFENLFLKSKRSPHDHNIIVSGHRGGNINAYPENTMKAFDNAIKSGFKCIELDVSKYTAHLQNSNILILLNTGLVNEGLKTRRFARRRQWRATKM